MKFIAKCKCQYGGRIYQKGEDIGCVVGEVTNINPPEDYFDRISDDAPQVEEANKEEADEERDSRESWMKKLDEKGIPYDKRWGAAKLQAEFINGTKGL